MFQELYVSLEYGCVSYVGLEMILQAWNFHRVAFGAWPNRELLVLHSSIFYFRTILILFFSFHYFGPLFPAVKSQFWKFHYLKHPSGKLVPIYLCDYLCTFYYPINFITGWTIMAKKNKRKHICECLCVSTQHTHTIMICIYGSDSLVGDVGSIHWFGLNWSLSF